MPAIYEVNLHVDAAIAGEYRAWLARHIREMLALPGFTGARWFEVADPQAAGEVAFCCQYELADQAALDAYFRDHAEHMRADGARLFGGRFRASRRVLRPLPPA